MSLLIFLFLIILILPLVVLLLLLRAFSDEKRVCIVVLGDIGRSPRMQYHALSFASHEWLVDFIGYGGSKPHSDVIENPAIKCHYISAPSERIQKLPRMAIYVLKVLWQSGTLALKFMMCKKPSFVLLQNPPALPALAVLWFCCFVRGSRLVLDWHNYGYTILSLALGTEHPFAKFSKWYEKLFGRSTFANICVTDAMRQDLKDNWNIKATTMHDRPPRMFRSIDVDTQHKLFVKLSHQYSIFSASPDVKEGEGQQTRLTELNSDGHVKKRKDRPALLISSTSWTEDEDFSVLLQALEDYELAKQNDAGSSLPDLLCAITGKGPQKKYYQECLAKKSWKHVTVITPWLEAEDYPLLLGSADIGVCLHTSSSGLDLPMKVVDMFGCGLPVCAINFHSLPELVRHNHNGLIFQTSSELSGQLQTLLRGFPNKCEQLDTFRDNLKAFQSLRWQQAWDANVLPLFSRPKSE